MRVGLTDRLARHLIKYVVSTLTTDAPAFLARLQRRIAGFYRKARIDSDDPHEIGFAEPFTLAYAAGSLASSASIIPWPEPLIRRAIRHRYWRALDRRSGPTQVIRDAPDRVLRELQNSDVIIDVVHHPTAIDPAIMMAARVLLLPHDPGGSLLAVQPAYFRRLVGSSVSARLVAAELERRGVLLPRSNGRRTRQLRLPSSAVRRDYYCLKSDLFDELSDGD